LIIIVSVGIHFIKRINLYTNIYKYILYNTIHIKKKYKNIMLSSLL
jgi:hypothetical protein